MLLPRQKGEKLSVRASAPGYGPAEATVRDRRAVRLILAPGRPQVIGVRDDLGQPVPGVMVRSPEGTRPWGLTDEQGQLSLRVPTAGNAVVVLRAADGRFLQRRLGPRLDPEQAEVVELPQPRRLRGRVLDAESRSPVADAFIWRWREPGAAVRSDATGVYRVLDITEGLEPLQVAAVGYLVDTVFSSNVGDRAPTMLLHPASAVSGRVVDEVGQPLAGAEIEASATGRQRMGWSRRFVAQASGSTAVSGADGGFYLGNLLPGVLHALVARLPGYATTRQEIGGLEPRRILVGQQIVLRRGGRATGKVVSTDSLPVVGAQVFLHEGSGGRSWDPRPPRDDEPFTVEIQSDEEGRFELANVAEGTFDLTVRAPGYAEVQRPGLRFEQGEAKDLGTLTAERGVAIVGRVTDPAGEPLEGAEVVVTPSDPERTFGAFQFVELMEPAAVSGADGGFEVSDRRPGEMVDLAVSAEGFASQGLPAVTVPPDLPLAVVLHPGSAIAGQVVDAVGRPIAGAALSISRFLRGVAGVASIRGRQQGPSTTDAAGMFLLENVAPGTISLSAAAEGWQPAVLTDLEVPEGENLTGVELVMQPGAVVEGRVYGADGEPLGGAYVTIEERGLPGGMGSMTDGDGHYRLGGVAPGQRTLVAEDDDFRRVVRKVEVQPGSNRVDLHFQGGVEVTGRVTDEAGDAVADANVWLSPPGSYWGGHRAVTNSEGSFRLRGVRDGEYNLYGSKEGFARTKQGATVSVRGAPVSGLELRLRKGSVISGRLLGVEPAELAQVQIEVGAYQRAWASGEVTYDGGYRVSNVVPGDWRVTAKIRGTGRRAEGRVAVEEGVPETVLDLEFGEGLMLTGQILTDSQGLAGAEVHLRGIDVASGASVMSDQAGSFTAEGLKPGSYLIEVAHPLSGLRHREEVTLDGDTDIRIELATGSVTGYVLDEIDSTPHAGVVVTLRPAGAEDRSSHDFSRGTTTDSRGFFQIRHLVAGIYRLTAQKQGYAQAEATLHIEPGSAGDPLEIALRPTQGLTLDLTLPSGLPAELLFYAVLDASGRAVAGGYETAGESGRFRLSTIPEGSYELVLATPGAATVSTGATAPGPALRVVLPPPCELSIRVPELYDDDLIARVSLTGADGRPHRSPGRAGHVDESWPMSFGIYGFRRLPPGTWMVRVEAPDGRTWQGTARTDPGRAARIDLR